MNILGNAIVAHSECGCNYRITANGIDKGVGKRSSRHIRFGTNVQGIAFANNNLLREERLFKKMQFIGHDGITTIEIDQSIGEGGIRKEATFGP